MFSGDTRVCESFRRGAAGADVLVSEAVNLALMDPRIKFLRASGNERMAMMMEEACDYHAPTLEVAAMARDAGVGQVVIAHLIPPVPNDGPQVEAFLAGMGDIYRGPIALGRDLQRVEVGA